MSLLQPNEFGSKLLFKFARHLKIVFKDAQSLTAA